MNFEKLSDTIFHELNIKICNHSGLKVFAIQRAKFEGWLKIELCNILYKYYEDVIPEKNRVDVSFKDWGIELKTLNTNIRYLGVENKTRPITKNVKGVLDDIKKLKKLNYRNRAVFFVVFPITHNNQYWQVHLEKIEKEVSQLKYFQFNFKDNVASGVMYFGLI